ncbi:jg15133 [Pararge aegeria aegeria]|uniref:Jg15133 protein n=1 Tax=Pararge aegeria aegeria TaxID=348720 RepID=A0A8S4S3F3_9NEOP|nr:jg15133 [Pararge aegeria aegeria]
MLLSGRNNDGGSSPDELCHISSTITKYYINYLKLRSCGFDYDLKPQQVVTPSTIHATPVVGSEVLICREKIFGNDHCLNERIVTCDPRPLGAAAREATEPSPAPH